MNHPLAQLFGVSGDDGDNKHALMPEAQIVNLQAAWENYSAAKEFAPGDIVRCREGLSIFRDEPGLLLYVRPLDYFNPLDALHIEDTIDKQKWNKIDCVVMRVHDTGTAFFLMFDQDLLERVP